MTIAEVLKLQPIYQLLDPITIGWLLKHPGIVTPGTTKQLREALAHESFIKLHPFTHAKYVKNYFKDNTVMINKWLRYANNIRSL
jgi:hypothetical protein